MSPCAYWLVVETFGTKTTTSGKFQYYISIKAIAKQ